MCFELKMRDFRINIIRNTNIYGTLQDYPS